MSLSDLTTLTASLGFTERDDPFGLFREWFADAEKSEPNDPNAMALSTIDDAGLPNVRMVLLKGWDERGFVFYTNFESQKGQEILGAGKAAFVMHWKSLRRQVRVRGLTEEVSKAEADDYFNSRPRDSRIGAWASQQSRPLTARFELETAVAIFPGRRIGAAFASSRCRLNFGMTGRSACMTGLCSGARRRMAGGRRLVYTHRHD
jgi:pyridoxamine 5'-phosphate oxidase